MIVVWTKITVLYYTIFSYYDRWFSNYCGPK